MSYLCSGIRKDSMPKMQIDTSTAATWHVKFAFATRHIALRDSIQRPLRHTTYTVRTRSGASYSPPKSLTYWYKNWCRMKVSYHTESFQVTQKQMKSLRLDLSRTESTESTNKIFCCSLSQEFLWFPWFPCDKKRNFPWFLWLLFGIYKRVLPASQVKIL